MPGLKLISSDELLFTVFHSL